MVDGFGWTNGARWVDGWAVGWSLQYKFMQSRVKFMWSMVGQMFLQGSVWHNRAATGYDACHPALPPACSLDLMQRFGFSPTY